MTDAVNHPQHYNHGKYEVINILEDQLSEMPLDAFGGFCLANSLKYELRAPYKGKPKEDLEKALWYLQRLIDHEEDKDNAKQETKKKEPEYRKRLVWMANKFGLHIQVKLNKNPGGYNAAVTLLNRDDSVKYESEFYPLDAVEQAYNEVYDWLVDNVKSSQPITKSTVEMGPGYLTKTVSQVTDYRQALIDLTTSRGLKLGAKYYESGAALVVFVYDGNKEIYRGESFPKSNSNRAYQLAYEQMVDLVYKED